MKIDEQMDRMMQDRFSDIKQKFSWDKVFKDDKEKTIPIKEIKLKAKINKLPEELKKEIMNSLEEFLYEEKNRQSIQNEYYYKQGVKDGVLLICGTLK